MNTIISISEHSAWGEGVERLLLQPLYTGEVSPENDNSEAARRGIFNLDLSSCMQYTFSAKLLYLNLCASSYSSHFVQHPSHFAFVLSGSFASLSGVIFTLNSQKLGPLLKFFMMPVSEDFMAMADFEASYAVSVPPKPAVEPPKPALEQLPSIATHAGVDPPDDSGVNWISLLLGKCYPPRLPPLPRVPH